MEGYEQYFGSGELATRLRGNIAESACCDYFGIPRVREVIKGGDDGSDFYLGAWRCQSKNSSFQSYGEHRTELKTNRCNKYEFREKELDIIILSYFPQIPVDQVIPWVQLLGWIDPKTFEARCFRTGYSYGGRWAVKDTQLFPMEDLWRLWQRVRGDL